MWGTPLVGDVWLNAQGGDPDLSISLHFGGPFLARCRGWRPPGLSTFSFFVLNAEGGGPPTRFDVDDLVVIWG